MYANESPTAARTRKQHILVSPVFMPVAGRLESRHIAVATGLDQFSVRSELVIRGERRSLRGS
jgi:hypothetical protein